jgi:phenylalanyl-tRNA synthetase beta subunit
LKEAFVFDFYKKDPNNIKIGFRFIFQSRFSTLTISDVDEEMINIVNASKRIAGIEIPGL